MNPLGYKNWQFTKTNIHSCFPIVASSAVHGKKNKGKSVLTSKLSSISAVICWRSHSLHFYLRPCDEQMQ